ncbi:MAG: exosortase/archaeosortase family protein [Pirellulales bacterium]|nr:exosortase/archaeosortase family protein [Pirellulales bacterium]
MSDPLSEIKATLQKFRELPILQQIVMGLLSLTILFYFVVCFFKPEIGGESGQKLEFSNSICFWVSTALCGLALACCAADLTTSIKQGNTVRSSLNLSLMMLTLVVFSYAYELYRIISSWTRLEYESGFLIPIMAVVVLWVWRREYKPAETWEAIVGLGIILACLIVRFVTVYAYRSEQFALYSSVLVIAGLVMLFGGLNMLRWTWPGMLLLLLAIPFSSKMERLSFDNLQKFSTRASVYAMETMGVDVTSNGNDILIRRDNEEKKLSVAEACAGFRGMLTLLSITLCWSFLVNVDLWIKIVMVASAPVIAMAANVVRIILQCFASMMSDGAGQFFHDYAAGFVVFPIMFGLMYLEYVILRNLVLDDEHATAIPMRSMTPASTLGAMPNPASAGVPIAGLVPPKAPVPVNKPAIPPVFKR